MVNRNANRPDVPTTRKSAASAITEPAPAAMPWILTMIGIGHSRIARITSPVILVNDISSPAFIFRSSPMISLTSPPPQKPFPSPWITSTFTPVWWGSSASRSRRSAYDSKVSGLSFSGRLSVTVATAPSTEKSKCSQVVVSGAEARKRVTGSSSR